MREFNVIDWTNFGFPLIHGVSKTDKPLYRRRHYTHQVE